MKPRVIPTIDPQLFREAFAAFCEGMVGNEDVTKYKINLVDEKTGKIDTISFTNQPFNRGSFALKHFLRKTLSNVTYETLNQFSSRITALILTTAKRKDDYDVWFHREAETENYHALYAPVIDVAATFPLVLRHKIQFNYPKFKRAVIKALDAEEVRMEVA